MNICLISQEYPLKSNFGGIATYTQTLARELVNLGQRVHVITSSRGDEEFEIEDVGAFVHHISGKPKSSFSWMQKVILKMTAREWHPILNFSQRVYEKISEIHLAEPLDIIESPDTCAQSFYTNKFIEGPKKVVRLHTPFFWVRHLNRMVDMPEHFAREAIEQKQAIEATAITSPTKALADIVVKQWGIKSVRIIPNFFNLKNYEPDFGVYNTHLKDEHYVMFFGRLEFRKGVHILAEALKDLFQKDIGIKAVFVGDDSVYNNCSMKKTVISTLHEFANRIIFIDNIPHNSLYPIIEKAKFIILPSLWENFPYACLEAMALGKVVIATTGSGFSEIIDDGVSGILCEPGNVSDLSKKLIGCLGRADLELVGQNARRKVRLFDNTAIVRQMLAFYDELIGE